MRFWPAGRMSLRYRLKRDLSDRVKWCLLEDINGGDIAGLHYDFFVPVYGAEPADGRIGSQLRRYLLRDASGRPWLSRISGIVVSRGIIAVATQLRANRRTRQIAAQICDLIQGADVADFTAGHTASDATTSSSDPGPDGTHSRIAPDSPHSRAKQQRMGVEVDLIAQPRAVVVSRPR